MSKALGPVTELYKLSVGTRRSEAVTYLDTADWRLRKHGLVLSHQRASGPGELVLTNAVRTWRTPLVEPPVWPARADQLAPGQVRHAAAPAMWVRAVAPVARSRVVSREVAALNEDGKTVARLDWQEATSVQPPVTQPLVQVSVRPVVGFQRDADRVAAALLAGGQFEPTQATIAEELLHAAASVADGDSQAVTKPGMPADAAVATALLGFADAIAAKVDGVIRDVDTEYLHELRVAVRRTRSLIKLAGDVLPAGLADRYAPEFKWLGDLTTPSRDLDVYLLEIDELSQGLVAGMPSDLNPFGEYLRGERDKERRHLLRGLRSQRFGRVLDGWRSELADVIERGGTAEAWTVEQLAAHRVEKATQRVVLRALSITPESPSEDIHALRKRCKELRYLLEVFHPIADAKAHRRAVKDLKRLQDVLGSFQDGEVQSASLRDFAARMLADGRAPAATLLAMGELSARFARKQADARQDLVGALRRYLRPKTRRRIVSALDSGRASGDPSARVSKL